MKTEQIRIAIVDDHALFRGGVAALMGEYQELKVLFQADNGYNLQQKLAGQKLLPQVILMDISMPVMDGYAATAWLKEKHPQIKVLALSMFEDDKAVIRMIKCGAGGYLLKESNPADLLEAIIAVHQKGIYINELVSGKMIRTISTPQGSDLFSNNEIAFLQFCCTELTYKEIADQMFVSPRTVDNYRESLFRKLNLKSRTGLVLYALQHQIVKF